jgi:hypothetical protein
MSYSAVTSEAGNSDANLSISMAKRDQLGILRYLESFSLKGAPYDIFRKDLLGTPVWMETVQHLETAKLRMTELADRSPGEYFVFSQESQDIVSSTPSRL